jgi:hypothetical protein
VSRDFYHQLFHLFTVLHNSNKFLYAVEFSGSVYLFAAASQNLKPLSAYFLWFDPKQDDGA